MRVEGKILVGGVIVVDCGKGRMRREFDDKDNGGRTLTVSEQLLEGRECLSVSDEHTLWTSSV